MTQTVLIVENEAAHVILLATLLEVNGYHAVCASDGIQALNVLATQPVALVLMDVWMPNLNGAETAWRMRKIPKVARLPIIFVTADAMSTTLNKLADLNPAGIVTKPFDSATLLDAVREALVMSQRLNADTGSLEVRGTTIQLYDPSVTPSRWKPRAEFHCSVADLQSDLPKLSAGD